MAGAPAPPRPAVNRALVGLELHLDVRAGFDHERCALREACCHRAPGARQDPGESLPGYAHLLSGRVLVESFEIGQPDCLELVSAEMPDRAVAGRSSDWPEAPDGRLAADSAGDGRPRHAVMSICPLHRAVKSLPAATPLASPGRPSMGVQSGGIALVTANQPPA